ncbi:hypothetical protein FisN_1Lh480 [Fistulifera solaris]|uniref:ArsA/GET3 Anion-transporting ATPase-like domain-containing protein n=1 Tax=Fistulifera solaris TaxID=1519565 RepID=A0A1Z5K1J8_FISSO|nr:hypothetical protein FisN_1Lh480 [Fistulifera solaris]|eukprot:GAX20039.1 hypothetical protein FisN_1Lh480 [Fistulifera solaris]
MRSEKALVIVLSACLILGINDAFQPLRAFQVYPQSGIRRVEHPTIAPSARRRSECFSWQTQSSLYSLKTLMDDLSDSSMSGTRTIFVGGKGGVGKTSVSSALAVSLASDIQKDLKVLIVSTDPAHSLGDALDEDLRKSHGKPLQMTDPLTGGRLFACEVDAAAALDEFRENLAAFDIDQLADALNISPDILESLGLREFSGLLNNPPPGLDELVALSNVLDTDSMAGDFDVIVVDTAPTGHTLRLLALPKFLDGLLGKLINLRMKLAGLTSTLQAFLGNSQAEQRAKTIDDAVNRLEKFRTKMGILREKLQDRSKTNFIVVTIPSKLGVQESKRLVSELGSQQVSVTDIVVNQCIGGQETEDTTPLEKYYERRRAGQERWMNKLSETIKEVSESNAYRANGSPNPICLTKVPFFDVELVGVPALAYLGNQCYAENPGFAHLMEAHNERNSPKVVICGGKGGVGKTTTSSSLAVTMAAKGHRVALISTDPAHSLGDAIDMNLAGGRLVDCPLIGVPPGDGSLSVLEIDPAASLSEFKGLVDQLVGVDDASEADAGFRNTLREIQEVFNTLPAGTDEVVALAKIIKLVKNGDYDRIVLDTAPTGHTLRMLSTPGFIAELIERLLAIAEKVNSNSLVKMFIGGSSRSEQIANAAATAKSALLSFQFQMYDLEDLFADAEQTEFLIVTIASELAARESIRLLNDLTFEAPDMPIKVRNVVVNQVLEENDKDLKNFVSHVSHGQKVSIDNLESFLSSMGNPPRVTKCEYMDTEPRGVFGLRMLADQLLKED